MNKKSSILCINLGTPENPTLSSVKKYLKEFLMDRRVIALPAWVRWILVHLFIVPFRSKQSTKNYQSIWTDEGSPLRVHLVELIHKLQNKYGTKAHVTYAMRYGYPSIPEVLEQLCKTSEELTIIPLYPQYASATNGSSLEAVFETLKCLEAIPSVRIIRDFYNDNGYIKALAHSISPYLSEKMHLLLSYHGLPENQLMKLGCKPVCSTECPVSLTDNNKPCYRQQCFATSRLLANELQLKNHQYSVSFQSRLGKTPWIKPYTDETLLQLASQGVKHLAIACPSFVADCLETLEEIGMQAKQSWKDLGGESFQLIPCLNAQDQWIDALYERLTRQD